ncbi:Multidomain esterase [Anaerolineales bacterium]|nr:Multidomain esterase [Anaerolineales bacterium]
MNRVAVYIILTALLAACAQSVIQDPAAVPSPTVSPTVTPTMTVEPSATPSPTSTVTVTPSCYPIKIMPLGDSITYGEGIVGYGGYRNLLGALLESDGIPFDFVGSQKSAEDVLPDPDNEGHSGWRIADIRDAIETEGWLETYQPDIILLHVGSNDLHHVGPNHRQDVNLADTIENLSALLGAILARRPEAHVIVAYIIRTRWGSDSNHVLYNEAIPEIAASKGEHVSVVDMQDILLKNDFITLYHPNPRGYDKMAHAWEKAILALGLKCSASR